MRTKIADFLRTAHTCLLLVSPEIRRLEDAADELLSVYAWPYLSIGHELGTALLSENPQRRSHAVQRWMKARTSEMSPGSVLCTGIDLLFEPTLGLDPLRLPELFPFRFTLAVDDLRADPRFAVQRQGAGWDMVGLVIKT